MEQTKLKSPKDLKEQYYLSEMSQWRLRRAGELDFYRLGGKIFYDQKMISDFLEKRKNVALRTTAKTAA